MIGRHRTQIADRGLHHLPALLRQLLPLRGQLPRLRLLLRRQMLPGLNPVQAALLFLRRQVIEILQPIHEPLLLLRRKLAELRVALQCFLLVCQRQIAMGFKPVSAVSLNSLRRPWYFSRL